MAWEQILINVKASETEIIEDFLLENGALSVTFVDAKDTPMYEPKPGEIKLWPDTQVIGLFEQGQNPTEIVKLLTSTFPQLDSPKIQVLEDKNWEREWMDNFHPMKFGEKLWICPSWSDIPEPNAVNLLLDPGLAFGTGTHPTTSLCLKWLDSFNLEGKTVVDFGCGSGVLAIAALLLGAKRVIGIDIDPQAIQASHENAKRNSVEDKLELFLPEHQPKLDADLVIANILAGPLQELNQIITDYCKLGGNLVMSGILEEQSQNVIDCYKNKFSFSEVVSEGEWVRLNAVRSC